MSKGSSKLGYPIKGTVARDRTDLSGFNTTPGHVHDITMIVVIVNAAQRHIKVCRDETAATDEGRPGLADAAES